MNTNNAKHDPSIQKKSSSFNPFDKIRKSLNKKRQRNKSNISLGNVSRNGVNQSQSQNNGTYAENAYAQNGHAHVVNNSTQNVPVVTSISSGAIFDNQPQMKFNYETGNTQQVKSSSYGFLENISRSSSKNSKFGIKSRTNSMKRDSKDSHNMNDNNNSQDSRVTLPTTFLNNENKLLALESAFTTLKKVLNKHFSLESKLEGVNVSNSIRRSFHEVIPQWT